VGHGNDKGVVAPTVTESKPIRAMELLLRHLANASAHPQPLAVMMEPDTSLSSTANIAAAN